MLHAPLLRHSFEPGWSEERREALFPSLYSGSGKGVDVAYGRRGQTLRNHPDTLPTWAGRRGCRPSRTGNGTKDSSWSAAGLRRIPRAQWDLTVTSVLP